MKGRKKYIKILIADDHNLVRQGVIGMLDDEEEIIIVGEASNGKELIEKYFEKRPDLVLTDISMPKMSGTETAKKIISKDPDAKILFLTMLSDEEYIYYGKKSGGLGLIGKDSLKSELLHAIKSVVNGKEYFMGISKEDLDSIMNRHEIIQNKVSYNDMDNLIPREKQVLVLIAQGLKSKDIAVKLQVSKKLIDFDRSNIIAKMNLDSLSQLVKFAIDYTNSKENVEKTS